MSKITIKEDGIEIEAEKITLGGDTTVTTGEFVLDEHGHVLQADHN